jgi:hypothetical protein
MISCQIAQGEIRLDGFKAEKSISYYSTDHPYSSSCNE